MAVLEFLRERQWEFCVASSGNHDKMAHTLGITGLQHYFAGRIFSASEVVRGKPAPDLFLHAARRLDFAPHHCIVVEDSERGLTAATAAGLECLIVSSRWTKEGDFRSARKVLENVSLVPDEILSWASRRKNFPDEGR